MKFEPCNLYIFIQSTISLPYLINNTLRIDSDGKRKPARQESTEHIEEGAIKRYKIERIVLLRVCSIETFILNRLTHTGVLRLY